MKKICIMLALTLFLGPITLKADYLDEALSIGDEDAAVFMVVVSDNIWYSDEGCFFITADGKYSVSLEADTLLLDRFGYEITFDDIVPGTEMFVWACFVTASVPGQVFPDKIILIN